MSTESLVRFLGGRGGEATYWGSEFGGTKVNSSLCGAKSEEWSHNLGRSKEKQSIHKTLVALKTCLPISIHLPKAGVGVGVGVRVGGGGLGVETRGGGDNLGVCRSRPGWHRMSTWSFPLLYPLRDPTPAGCTCRHLEKTSPPRPPRPRACSPPSC